ncbi:MAG TPA: hypothetical protein VFT22_13930, partial [Kofleriaceae bacterium]|nr:hypothetical protein [Kofleriaceae bacterium]
MSDNRSELEILRDLAEAQRKALANAEKLVASDHEVIERQRAEIAKAGELIDALNKQVEVLENTNTLLKQQVHYLDSAIKKILGESPPTPEQP